MQTVYAWESELPGSVLWCPKGGFSVWLRCQMLATVVQLPIEDRSRIGGRGYADDATTWPLTIPASCCKVFQPDHGFAKCFRVSVVYQVKVCSGYQPWNRIQDDPGSIWTEDPVILTEEFYFLTQVPLIYKRKHCDSEKIKLSRHSEVFTRFRHTSIWRCQFWNAVCLCMLVCTAH